MFGTRRFRSLLALLATLAVVFGYSHGAVAQSTEDMDAKMRAIQQQVDELNKQLKTMKEEQAKTTKQASTVDKAFSTFMKGFFGTLDASVDYTTKGMEGMVAYPWGYASGAPGSPYVITGPAKGGGAGPYGNVSWIAAMSSNGSSIGYRGSHQIGSSHVDFIYQVATSLNLVAAPGLQNTWTKSSNTVQGAIGLGDTFIGFQAPDWGRVRFGELLTPYRTSTDRLNPFAGMLGDYSVVMGNTGGDNRVEFGTRMDHVVTYASPNWQGVSFEAAYSFGQQLDRYSNLMPQGSPDCAGSNNPGSGNLFLNCDDGGFDDAYSAALKFENKSLYLVGAYEMHKRVNRSSDGIGANHPYYGYVFGLGPNDPLSAQLLDWASYQAFAGEFPGAAAAGSPGYNPALDTADEWAMKFGGQYHFEFGLTVSYFWEQMHRSVPDSLQFQNERQRMGSWVALDYQFPGGTDRIAAGWAHAGATPGDPGGQHNFDPTKLGGNQSNMYTIAWWHKLDKQLSLYLNAAMTANDGNSHYDLGAGTHGIKTDCHDATHTVFIDYSSAGPTTWGGCRPIGVSTGVNFKF